MHRPGRAPEHQNAADHRRRPGDRTKRFMTLIQLSIDIDGKRSLAQAGPVAVATLGEPGSVETRRVSSRMHGTKCRGMRNPPDLAATGSLSTPCTDMRRRVPFAE